MRILQLRFKNLNSLVGEWEIDLTHPAFLSDGIFAITGPTGAGKSTILDAICLALYARTPRLNKISKNTNEIMSQQTGECFAEVSFTTQAGCFRCHWSQHRARKNPEGELQAPKHEIANADSGQILATNRSGVSAHIETATGMNFDRFTRSMLLAQGGFAAFLQAPPNERAPILEQITGTEIYSHISIRAHETRTEERKKLDKLHAELAGIQLLSKRDRQQLGNNLEQKTMFEAGLSKKINHNNQAITWLDGMKRLEESLTEIANKKQALLVRQEAFKPMLKKLKRANLALELTGQHAAFISLHQAQQNDTQCFNEYQKTIPQHVTAMIQAQKDLQSAKENLTTKKIEQQKTLHLIRKIRELDLKLSEQKTPIEATKNTIMKTQKHLNSIESKIIRNKKHLNTCKTSISQLRKTLNHHQNDEKLIANLSGLIVKFNLIREFSEKHQQQIKEITCIEKTKKTSLQRWNEQTYQLKIKSQELATIQKKIAQQQVELNTHLAGKTTTDWRDELTRINEEEAILSDINEILKILTEANNIALTLNIQQQQLDAEKNMLATQISEYSRTHASMEREIQLLETQASLLNKILSFENARQQLQDNEACPLCGALEHPFAKENIPHLGETQNKLTQRKTQLKILSNKISKLKIKHAEALKTLELTDLQQQNIKHKNTASENKITEKLALLLLDISINDLTTKLPQLLQEINATQYKTSNTLQLIEQHENIIYSFRESLEKSNAELIHAERNVQIAKHQNETAEQSCKQADKELTEILIQLEKTQQDTLSHLTPYGISHLDADAIDRIQTELAARREQWLVKHKKYTELEQEISTLELQIKHQTEIILQANEEIITQQDLLHNLLHDRDQLRQQRHTLFADKIPDQEESHLASMITDNEKYLDNMHNTLSSTSQQFTSLKSKTDALEKSIAQRGTELKILHATFLTQLTQSGFVDETDYLAACLPEETRNTLVLQAQQLDVDHSALNAMQQDKTANLETERQKKLSQHQAREPLALLLQQDIAKRTQVLQEMGSIRQQLNDDETLRCKHQERAIAIDAQKRECLRWDTLHELIGSADGRKYRNFAQGLTLEMMLGHANRQLQKMTDRYLLIRDNTQPLELSIIDNYQAAKIRSIKNLSGGESFIVSLSLALGLSHMASKNVRVDSLFLDEGFGSLDEEALDTALEALAGLQQNGKLIGVISHVPTLQERISTQIQVSPHTGGTSLIRGPGCRRLTTNKPLPLPAKRHPEKNSQAVLMES